MRVRVLVLGGLGVVAAGCFGVKTVPTSAGPVAIRQATSASTLPPGVLLHGKLNTTIGMSASHPGDVVGVTLSENITAGRATVVPSGAVAYGHVVAVNSGADAGVHVAFDSLTFGGQSHVLDANITATDASGVSVQPVRTEGLGAHTVASATRISFAGGAQLSAGSTLTLVTVTLVRVSTR